VPAPAIGTETRGDGAGRFDEFKIARAVKGGKTLAGVAVAVSNGVAVVDTGILHLDDEEKISGGNGCSGSGCGADGNFCCSGRDVCGAGIVSVNRTAQLLFGTA